MATMDILKAQYDNLDQHFDVKSETAIAPEKLLVFDYQYPDSDAEVHIETDEFTAVCPWTGLPDYGQLSIHYIPRKVCLELKSLKYYLLSFRDVGMVQEHVANRILEDLTAVSNPKSIKVVLDYKTRGGLHTVVTIGNVFVD